MSSALANLPVMHHQYLVSADDGAQPMRDSDGSAAAHEYPQRALNFGLDLAVNRTGSLVEEEKRRISSYRTGKRQELPLTNTHGRTALSQNVAVTIGKTLDDPVGADADGALSECRVIQGRGQADVRGNVASEEKYVLLNVSDKPAQFT